ncbi:hypothetical protein D918_08173 [Trichuris suis]|nr:hypothetical protein D918_08173 [Trichuris suis]
MPLYGQILDVCPEKSKLITNRFGQPTRCLPHRTDLCSRDAPAPSNTCCYRSYGDYFCCAGVAPQLCPTYENVTSIIYKQLYADGTRVFPFRRSLMNKRFGEYNNIIRNGDIFAPFEEQSQPLHDLVEFSSHLNPYGGRILNGPPGVAPPNGISVMQIKPPKKKCEQPEMEPSVIESPAIEGIEKGTTVEAPTTSEQQSLETLPRGEDESTTPLRQVDSTATPSMEWTTVQLPTLTTARLERRPFLATTTTVQQTVTAPPKTSEFQEKTEKSSKPEGVIMEYANRYDNRQSQWLLEAYNSWLSRPPAVQRQLTTASPTYSEIRPPGVNPPDHFRTIYDERAQPAKMGAISNGWIKPSQLMRRHAIAKERARRSGIAPSLFNFDLPKAYHRNVKPSVAVGNVQQSTLPRRTL